MKNQNSIMIQSYYNDISQIRHKLSVIYYQFSYSGFRSLCSLIMCMIVDDQKAQTL